MNLGEQTMEISGKTRLICLLGHPVAHSISPMMHNLAFKENNLDYCYMAYDLKEDQIKEAVDSLKLFDARGFNLTMPFKQSVIPYLDELSQKAKLCNSVNTVVNENGRLIGYTTDGYGFMESLRFNDIKIKDSNFTVLGGGGAATAIITEAAFDGANSITVFKRKNATFKKLVNFAENVSKASGCNIKVCDMADSILLKDSLLDSQVLINATNVGMGDDDTSLVPKEFLYKELIVTDVIYHPSATRLLKDAKEVGCKTMNGKLMLLYQGAAAFKKWTNTDMPVDLIRERYFMEEI